MNLDEQMYNREVRTSTIIWNDVWEPLNKHTEIVDHNLWHHIWIITNRNVDTIINGIQISVQNKMQKNEPQSQIQATAESFS